MNTLLCLLFLIFTLAPAHAAILNKFPVDYNDNTYGQADRCAQSVINAGSCPTPNFQSTPNPGAITITSAPSLPVSEGTHAIQHIAKPGQIAGFWNPCWLFGSNLTGLPSCDRSESEIAIPYTPDADEWYGFSVRIDSATQYTHNASFNDFNGQVIFQAHQLGGSCGSGFGPRLVIWFSNHTGSLVWNAHVDAQNNTGTSCPNVNLATRTDLPLGAAVLDQWENFVIHARWSTSNGLLQIWRNGTGTTGGTPTVTFTGINSFNNFNQTDVKWGVYQSWWIANTAGHIPPAGEKSIVYHDNIKVGNSASNFAEVNPAPSAAPLPNPPSNVAVQVH